MKGGYESIIWISDTNGREYACYADDFTKEPDNPDEDVLARCLDVNQLVGTERW